jgi:hypothetical protein
MTIEEHEHEIEMLADQHHQIEEAFEGPMNDCEAGISHLESELEEVDNDIQWHLDEIKKLKAIK